MTPSHRLVCQVDLREYTKSRVLSTHDHHISIQYKRLPTGENDDASLFLRCHGRFARTCSRFCFSFNLYSRLYSLNRHRRELLLARTGDELAMWLFGMGATTAPAANCCTSPDQLGKLIQPFLLNFDFRPNATASPAVPGYGVAAAPVFAAHVGEGAYQVNFTVPAVPTDLPPCDGVKIKSNLTITISGPNSYDAAQICVAVP